MISVNTRRAFTLVEMLVVTAIISLLLAITLPALMAARGSARNSQDKNNLRQLGMGLIQFADRDPGGRFCSGAVDYRRDGCPDTYGWVADLVNAGLCRPGDLLNPAASQTGNQVFSAMLNADGTTQPLDGATADRLAAGACSNNFNNTSGTSAPTRAEYLATKFLAKGHNTNYAASWVLVRGGLRVEPGASDTWTFKVASGNARGLGGTTGPLTKRAVDLGVAPSSNIPLLGDAAPGALSISILDTTIQDGNKLLESGAALSDSYNRGPAKYNNGAIELLAATTADISMTNQVRHDRGDDVAGEWLQDTRAWAPVHGKSCNLLMADGSVKEVSDQNSDGCLNPGFAIPAGAEAGGFKAGPVELLPGEVFSGVFLEKRRAVTF